MVSMTGKTSLCLFFWWVICAPEDAIKAQGLSLTQIRTLSGNFSLWIENKHDNEPFLGDIPGQYCSQTLWCDPTGGILKPLQEAVSDSSTTLFGINISHISKWLTIHPCTVWGIVAACMIKLPNIVNYIWVDQKSGLTGLGDRTKLYSCQDQTTGLLYQLFGNLFCSHRLTGMVGKWRCLDTNSTNGKGQGIFRKLRLQVPLLL